MPVKNLTGVPADKPRSYASIELEARQVRNLLGYKPHERLDVKRFFNCDLGEITLAEGNDEISICEAVEDCTSEGLSRWEPELSRLELVLSEATYALLQRDHVRARYTVLHEFGHIALHAAQIIKMTGLSLQSQVAYHRRKAEHLPYMDTEWQANAYASAILMPAQGIESLVKKRGRYESGLIASHFGASLEAATYRAHTYAKGL